jgi:hypothetical protein
MPLHGRVVGFHDKAWNTGFVSPQKYEKSLFTERFGYAD